jgi:hypothetical protein
MTDKKNNFISEEEFQQMESAGLLQPADETRPINPSLRPAAPPPPNPGRSKFSSGVLPAALGLEPDLTKTGFQGYGSVRLMPTAPSGLPNTGAAIASQVEPVRETANQAATTATTAQKTANQAIAKTFFGAWNAAVSYLIGSSVDSGGSIYLCIAANTNEMPPNATYWTLLSGSGAYVGVWDSTTAYTTGQIVSVSTSLYIALQNSTNEDPTSTTGYWQILSNTSFYYGTWSSTDAYPVGAQVSYQGNFYVATTANTNQTPSTTSSFWVLLGTSAILIGAWSSTVAYQAGMQVTFAPSGGATNFYVCLQQSTNNEPDISPTYWYLIANNTAINSASSYRPTTNPLSATDAGSSATITIASFTMNVAGVGAVSVNGGSITGLSYGTVYYIYYADPTISGGAVSYSYSTTKTDAITSGVDFFVGSIINPVSGGAPTLGANDGGTGAQYGFAANLYGGIATFSSLIDWTNPSNVNDGNPNSYASATINGLAPNHTLKISGFSGISPTYNSIVLNVKTESVISGGSVTVAYSTDGGQTFTTVRTSTSGWSVVTDPVTLSVTQNIGAVVVQLTYSTGGGSDILTLQFYEAWLVVQG